MTPEPTDEDRAAVSDGALTVTQAARFSGESRDRLFDLMKAGVLDWYHSGRDRRITRRSLVEHMARMRAARRATA